MAPARHHCRCLRCCLVGFWRYQPEMVQGQPACRQPTASGLPSVCGLSATIYMVWSGLGCFCLAYRCLALYWFCEAKNYRRLYEINAPISFQSIFLAAFIFDSLVVSPASSACLTHLTTRRRHYQTPPPTPPASATTPCCLVCLFHPSHRSSLS